MAVTFTYNINAGYLQTSSFQGSTFIQITNDTADIISVSSITFPAGTGNATYNDGASVSGNGGSIELTAYMNNVGTNTVTISNTVGRSSRIISESGEIVEIRYYPTYSDCQYYTLTFTSPVDISPYGTGYVDLWFGGSGNCFVWRRNEITGSYTASSNVYYVQYNKDDDSDAYWNYPWSGDSVGGGYITGTNQVHGGGDYIYACNPMQYPVIPNASNPNYLANAVPYLQSWYGSSINQGTMIIAPLLRPGYEFAGWHATGMTASYHFGPSNGQTTYDFRVGYNFIQEAFLRNSIGTVVFTARWSPQLTFNANGGSGTVNSTYVDYYDGVTLPASNAFTAPTNKHFVEWNTAADGTGTSYNANQSITVSNISSSTTLYAVWADNSATIHYKSNYSGGPADHNETVITSVADTVWDATSTWTRSGYKFIGWNTQTNGNGTKYPIGSNITVNANTDLYAVWYDNFKWTNADATNVIAGKPTTNATAAKFNELQSKLKNYVDKTYVITNIVSGSKMTASQFNNVRAKLTSVSSVTAGNEISAQDSFIAVKDALNDNAHYIV